MSVKIVLFCEPSKTVMAAATGVQGSNHQLGADDDRPQVDFSLLDCNRPLLNATVLRSSYPMVTVVFFEGPMLFRYTFSYLLL